jgi:hypothetical protein
MPNAPRERSSDRRGRMAVSDGVATRVTGGVALSERDESKGLTPSEMGPPLSADDGTGKIGVRGVVLHRDVFWLGRQWAVTGYGIQAVSKKHNMKFDIDVSRIWKDDLDLPMRDLAWFDAEDFAEALEQARKRASEQPLSFRPPLSDER